MSAHSTIPVPEAEASEICRKLGLAVSNASVYGVAHAVTATAQAAAYDQLVHMMDLYGDLEWGLCEEELLLNGKVVDVSRGTGQALLDKLQRGNLHNLTFRAPLDRTELGRFLGILTAEQAATASGDSLESAVAQGGFKSIRVDEAVYARKAKQAQQAEADALVESRRPGTKGGMAGSGARRVFDLDSEFEGLEAEGFSMEMPEATASSPDVVTMATQYLEKRREHLRQHEQMLELMRQCEGDGPQLEALKAQLAGCGFTQQEWAVLLAESGMVARRESLGHTEDKLVHLLSSVQELTVARASETDPQAMTQALKAISREVEVLIARTQGQAGTLAQRVEADRAAVAALEQHARESGVGLQLSREELLENLAEINQELVQPLTTSSTLLELLSSGRAGALPENQQHLLDSARDGLGRLEGLIVYLQRISGFPAALEPNAALLDEIYRPSSPSAPPAVCP